MTPASTLIRELHRASRELVRLESELVVLRRHLPPDGEGDDDVQRRLDEVLASRDALRQRFGATALTWMMRGGGFVPLDE